MLTDDAKVNRQVEAEFMVWAKAVDLAYWNCQMMEYYMPGLLAVGFGDISAERAIAALEDSDADDVQENAEKADRADREDEQAPPSGFFRRLMGQENWN